MEWSFIVAAVRRRIRFVVLCAILGAVPGLYSISKTVDEFSSTATVSIAAPQSAGFSQSQPDRYITSQIAVITSTDTLVKAAKQVGGGVRAGDIATALEVEQEPSADVLHVTATWSSGRTAAAIANAVVDVYLQEASLRAVNARSPEIERLNNQITALQTQINGLNASIAAKLQPYLDRAVGATSPFVPAADQVAAQEVQQKNALENQLTQVQQAKTALELGTTSDTAGSLIDKATTPSSPNSSKGKLILVGGTVLGGLGGIAVALVLAQLSSKVLDEAAVAQLLGTTVVGAFPRHRSLLDKPLNALKTTPPEARETLERVSVRAEAMADPEIDHALTIAVVGTQPSAGTTTLTLALARRLSRSGYSVVIVDGDMRTQTISEIFECSPNAGISAVLAAEVKKPSRPVNYFTETDLPKVEVLGVGKIERREALRRDAIGPILDAARDRGQIVLFDGGALMGSALTLFASKAADVIVLAVPLLEQDQDILHEVADNLPTERSRVLAVTTAPVRRRSRRPEPAEAESTKD